MNVSKLFYLKFDKIVKRIEFNDKNLITNLSDNEIMLPSEDGHFTDKNLITN